MQTVSSVSEAWRHLKVSQFDVLLADIGMPGVDGYAFIREVRESEIGTDGICRSLQSRHTRVTSIASVHWQPVSTDTSRNQSARRRSSTPFYRYVIVENTTGVRA